MDTVDANTALGFPSEARTYEAAEYILRDLGIKSVALLSNNPHKFNSLQKLGVEIDARQPVLVQPNPHSDKYLHVKQAKMGHALSHLDSSIANPPSTPSTSSSSNPNHLLSASSSSKHSHSHANHKHKHLDKIVDSPLLTLRTLTELRA